MTVIEYLENEAGDDESEDEMPDNGNEKTRAAETRRTALPKYSERELYIFNIMKRTIRYLQLPSDHLNKNAFLVDFGPELIPEPLDWIAKYFEARSKANNNQLEWLELDKVFDYDRMARMPRLSSIKESIRLYRFKQSLEPYKFSLNHLYRQTD